MTKFSKIKGPLEGLITPVHRQTMLRVERSMGREKLPVWAIVEKERKLLRGAFLTET